MSDFFPLHNTARAKVDERYITNGVASPIAGKFSNPGQVLDKLSPDLTKAKTYRKSFLDGWKKIADGKAGNTASNPHLQKVALALCDRRVASLKNLNESGFTTAQFKGKVVWRMILGMSNPNPLETSLTLHPQYGIPIIPASSVKGITRAWCLLTLADSLGIYPLSREKYREYRNGTSKRDTPLYLLQKLLLENPRLREYAQKRQKTLEELKSDEEVKAWHTLLKSENPNHKGIIEMSLEDLDKLEQVHHFLPIFGITDEQGGVIFQDALPVSWEYKVDVMTPHYGDYYMEKKDDKGNLIPPADYLEPNPITFLTIDKGSQFQFGVQAREHTLSTGNLAGHAATGNPLVTVAEEWLKKAISDNGVGGKTLIGYGEMEVQ
jgi:CRISPR type III-B/RAMP module RAMP protein Cmr6